MNSESSILHKKRQCLILRNDKKCFFHAGCKCNKKIKSNPKEFDGYYIIPNIEMNQQISLKNYFSEEKLLKCKIFYYWSDILVLDIPDSIEHLIYTKNKQICPLICNLTNLSKISFGDPFNKPIDNLPPNLKCLELSYTFNQPVDNLPNGLEKIIFNTNFNQPVDNLPESLKYIEFGYHFNQDITNLPTNIMTIKLNLIGYIHSSKLNTKKIFGDKIKYK